MLFEELLKDEREAGKEEGRKEGRNSGMAESLQVILSNFSVVPENLQRRIFEEKSSEVLKNWIQIAVQVNSLEEFISKM
ncbi:MAG: hypothetical protein E6686_07320 [Lachnospiraceae bacterium]|nr:hypothetical protein [Lachnospiraceae bacterium]